MIDASIHRCPDIRHEAYELCDLKNKLKGFYVSFHLHFFLQDIIPLQEKTKLTMNAFEGSCSGNLVARGSPFCTMITTY